MLSLRLSCLLLFALASLASPSLAAAKGERQGTSDARPASKIDRALRDNSGSSGATRRVIVRYRTGAAAAVGQRAATAGGRVLKQHLGIGAMTVALPAAAIERMAGDPDVLGLSLDAVMAPTQLLGGLTETTTTLAGTTQSVTDSTTVAGTSLFTSSGATVTTLLQSFDAQALRRTLGVSLSDTGSNVGIAIVDSGIAPTADLTGRISAFYDFTRGGVAAAPADGYGHGTHIAGLIAGNGRSSAGRYVGVAIGARLIGLKVLDAQGRGYTSDVISAVEFATANRVALGIDVINLSLGHPIYESAATDPLVQAVERAVAAGIVVVVSAGNRGVNAETGQVGYAGITSPGNAPSALTVGSARTK